MYLKSETEVNNILISWLN